MMGLLEGPRPTCEGEGGMRRSAGSLRPPRQATTVGRAVANTLEEAARASDMPLREHPKAVRKRRLSNTVPRKPKFFLLAFIGNLSDCGSLAKGAAGAHQTKTISHKLQPLEHCRARNIPSGPLVGAVTTASLPRQAWSRRPEGRWCGAGAGRPANGEGEARRWKPAKEDRRQDACRDGAGLLG